jgi:tetratricopeptide (TPR) repeat protein
LGNQVAAIAHCESAMTHPRTGDRRNLVHPGHHDRIIALVAFARALWLRGYPDQAAEAARYTVQEAELLEHPLTLCISMIWTVYISLWVGNWPSAEAIIERIIANATRYSLGPYQSVGPGLKGELLIRRGQPSAGVPLLRRHLEILQANRHQILTTVFATALAEGLTQLAEVDEALIALDTAIEQTGSAGESFDLPEMLRVKGQILRSARHDVAGSEACLRQALDLAHRQGALSWELRAATDLARLLRDRGRSTGGIAILRPVYDRFTEGFDTIDLKEAKSLLDALEA